jgi:hypothetical protein
MCSFFTGKTLEACITCCSASTALSFKTTIKLQAMEESAPETSEPLAKRLPLRLIATIRTAQAQNGVKYGDYARYRQAWWLILLKLRMVEGGCPDPVQD